MNNLFLTLIGLLLTSVDAYGQHNFDSIRICHTSQGELRRVVIGEYDVNIQNGELHSFSSHDDAVEYDFGKSKFTIKYLQKNSILGMALSNKGVVLETKDTTILVNFPKSAGLVPNGEEDSLELLSICHFSFTLDYKNGRISRMTVAVPGKFFIINLTEFEGVYSWNFYVESIDHANALVVTHASGKPNFLSVSDDKNKVGVRLLSRKGGGKITHLDGQEIYGWNAFATNESYRLKYSRKGRLKKSKSRFDLSCLSL
ncbi:MAG: hypothetical protein ACK4E0_00480 [Chitinophagaceae bacterium]